MVLLHVFECRFDDGTSLIISPVSARRSDEQSLVIQEVDLSKSIGNGNPNAIRVLSALVVQKRNTCGGWAMRALYMDLYVAVSMDITFPMCFRQRVDSSFTQSSRTNR